MTMVCAQRDGNRYVIDVNGHATGSETVCAAVSGILYALAGYLHNALESEIEICAEKMKSGRVYLEFRGGMDAEAVFYMTVIGLEQIEKKYPEYVFVEYREQ